MRPSNRSREQRLAQLRDLLRDALARGDSDKAAEVLHSLQVEFPNESLPGTDPEQTPQ